MSTSRVLPAHQFADLEQQRNAASLGMWLFLGTEVMVFGAIFTGYAAYRYQYPVAFEAASDRLNLFIGGLNTIVLLTSSLTMALAVRAAKLGRNNAVAGFVLATILLGALFLGFKAVEYAIDYRERLMPSFAFDPGDWKSRNLTATQVQQVQLFLCFYYFLTLLHGLHMIIGLGLLGVLVVMARRGTFSPEHYTPVEMCGLYWHFVDLVWIFLLPLLYLIGTRTSLWG